jgi:hypothetical protein
MVGITDGGVVACADCGCVHQDATALVAQLRSDVANLELELRTKRRAIKGLQGDDAHKAQASPHYQTAMRVLGFWKNICLPTARELNGKRLDHCLARLTAGYDEQRLNEAVLGYSHYPFIVNNKRSAIGEPSQWAADAELIFRSAKFVDNGIRLAHSHKVEIPASVLAQIPYRKVMECNRQAIIAFLTDRYGELLEEDGYLYSPCPNCPNGIAPLQIAPLGTSWVARCTACPLTAENLLAIIADPTHLAAGQLEMI